MNRFCLLLALSGILIPAPVLSGQAVPHLTGAVDIDLPRGLLTGDVCVSKLPAQDSVHFLLNRGLNIKSIRDAHGRRLRYAGYFGGSIVGEGLQYTVRDSADSSRTLCISYTGAFPVYDVRAGDFNTYDFKGAIAFNGRTLRAAEQAKWYPVMWDPKADRSHENVTYHLRVRCPACATIYVNGSPPRPGPEAEFRSAEPQGALLFAGDYAARQVGGALYLNSDIAPEAARALSGAVGNIGRFYERFLAVPYGDTIVFLEHQPLERYEGPRSWAFVTWPTVAFAGARISDFVETAAGPPRLKPWVWGFLAHEMAHFYFTQGSGPYKQFFGESVAEYLALRATRRFVGDTAYHARLKAYHQEVVKGPAPLPLDRLAERPSAADDRYRYRYGPLLLVALEREVGAQRMGRLLHAILTAPAGEAREYALLRRAALEAGVPGAVWQRWEARCVRPAPIASCLAELAPATPLQAPG